MWNSIADLIIPREIIPALSFGGRATFGFSIFLVEVSGLFLYNFMLSFLHLLKLNKQFIEAKSFVLVDHETSFPQLGNGRVHVLEFYLICHCGFIQLVATRVRPSRERKLLVNQFEKYNPQTPNL